MKNNNNKELKDVKNENKGLKIGPDGNFIYDDCKFAEKEYKYVKVNFATGEQFTKTAYLRSKEGKRWITYEQVKKFFDEAEKEANEWWWNHPGESVTIRVLEGEDGGQKQVIEVPPKNDLICGDFRTRIYDRKTGEQIVGEENIRKEVERREKQWEQWKKEGKLEKVGHEIHHTNDGSTVSFYTLLAPADAERLHPNEINDETKWAPLLGGNLIEGSKEKSKDSETTQQSENKASEGSSKEENIRKENAEDAGSESEKITEIKENVEDTEIVRKIKKNINEWSVKELSFKLSNGSKGRKDCLVHNSAKVNISELGTLIYPVEIFTESERKELAEVLNDSLLVNFISSGKIGRDALNKNNYRSISLSNSSTSDNNTQQTDKGKNALVVFGVAFVLLFAGLAVVKSRFSKKKKVK